jgi:GT2 family glycosyltransferase
MRTPTLVSNVGRTRFADGRLNPSSAWNRITLWSAFCFAGGLVKIAPRSTWLNPEGIGGWPRDTIRPVDVVSGCFFLIEATLWRHLDGFDPAFFMYGEEADLCARARALGVRPMMTPAATIIHHGGASTDNFANRIIYIFGARIELMQRHLGHRHFGRWTLLFAAWWRATLYGTLARLGSARSRGLAQEWREAWQRRSEWKNGPPQRAVK